MADILKSTAASCAQQKLDPQWGVVNGMPVALIYESPQIEDNRKKVVGITDVSCLERFGIKGPRADQWLSTLNIKVPDAPNKWFSHENNLVLRLGGSEFLIEEQFSGAITQQLNEAINTSFSGVYRVLRADAAFIISGSKRYAMLAELCKLDLSAQAFTENNLVMTQLADITATILTQTINGESVFRLWCDSTYGEYIWKTLHQLAQELGGGAVGFSSYFSDE